MEFFSKIGSSISGTFSAIKSVFVSKKKNQKNKSEEITFGSQPSYFANIYNESLRPLDPLGSLRPSTRLAPSTPLNPSKPSAELFSTRSIYDHSIGPRVCIAPRTTSQKTFSLVEPVNFLEMKQLDEYPIPEKVLAIELGKITQTDFIR